MDIKYQEAAQIVGMTFETMGLLVYRDLASFSIVQELCGGLLMMYWRKVGTLIVECRPVEGNPRFGEWLQWLAERIEEQEPNIQPAHLAHIDWKPKG